MSRYVRSFSWTPQMSLPLTTLQNKGEYNQRRPERQLGGGEYVHYLPLLGSTSHSQLSISQSLHLQIRLSQSASPPSRDDTYEDALRQICGRDACRRFRRVSHSHHFHQNLLAMQETLRKHAETRATTTQSKRTNQPLQSTLTTAPTLFHPTSIRAPPVNLLPIAIPLPHAHAHALPTTLRDPSPSPPQPRLRSNPLIRLGKRHAPLTQLWSTEIHPSCQA